MYYMFSLICRTYIHIYIHSCIYMIGKQNYLWGGRGPVGGEGEAREGHWGK